MKTKVAVILSGCGVYDGAEIQESVLTLLALARAGAEVSCLAPDIAQRQVIDHSNGDELVEEDRNVLVESARISRGEILPLDNVKADDFDVFIYVGDLSEVFRLIKCRNKRSGKLVFSTEHAEGDGFKLEQTGRYSHSERYIKSLCSKFDYSIVHFSKTPLRKEKDQFLVGGLYILSF